MGILAANFGAARNRLKSKYVYVYFSLTCVSPIPPYKITFCCPRSCCLSHPFAAEKHMFQNRSDLAGLRDIHNPLGTCHLRGIWDKVFVNRGHYSSYNTTSNNALFTIFWKNTPQNYHTFRFDPRKIGNLLDPRLMTIGAKKKLASPNLLVMFVSSKMCGNLPPFLKKEVMTSEVLWVNSETGKWKYMSSKTKHPITIFSFRSCQPKHAVYMCNQLAKMFYLYKFIQYLWNSMRFHLFLTSHCCVAQVILYGPYEFPPLVCPAPWRLHNKSQVWCFHPPPLAIGPCGWNK